MRVEVMNIKIEFEEIIEVRIYNLRCWMGCLILKCENEKEMKSSIK